jgi:hypothetical protein
LGVIETQGGKEPTQGNPITPSHVGNRGGAHFPESCKRKGILFLGVPDYFKQNIDTILGEPTEQLGNHSAYWDVDFKMINTLSGGRVEILGEANKNEYNHADLFEWAEKLRTIANGLDGEYELQGVANSFYYMSYDIYDDAGRSIADVHPFQTADQTKKEEISDKLKSIERVLENLELYDPEYELHLRCFPDRKEEYPLVAYLKEIAKKLEKRAAI